MMTDLDKPEKPYRRIDTYWPDGDWIDEKAYNRQRPTGTASRKVLHGNWLEERALESDLLTLEAKESQAKAQGTTCCCGDNVGPGTYESVKDAHRHFPLPRPWHACSSLDIFQPLKNGHYDGTFNSTPYIIRGAAHPSELDANTTYLTAYNERNSDVRRLFRPDLGVRSQLLLHQALNIAQQEQQKREEAREIQFHEDGSWKSEYTEKISDPRGVYPTIKALQTDYLVEEPITIYTGNPFTSKTMVVHGKTPYDPMSKPYHGKHTYFSERKYTI